MPQWMLARKLVSEGGEKIVNIFSRSRIEVWEACLQTGLALMVLLCSLHCVA